MADIPTPEQMGSAAVWFNSQAGISATVLAVVAIAEAVGLVAAAWWCRKSLREANEDWLKSIVKVETAWLEKQDEWAKRVDNMRSDVKEAFNQNDKIADKMVAAMHSVQTEIARLGGRRDR